MTMRGRIALGGLAFFIVAVGVFAFLRQGSKMNSRSLRMALTFNSSVKAIDPGAINTSFQYDLARNIYGRLVEYDAKGQLVAAVPESFSWHDNSVTFVFSDKVKTVDGYPVTARDAEVSLKRLVIQGKSGHGDIRRFLCPDVVLEKVSDPCPGIVVQDNRLILTVVQQHYLPLLIATLESADYSIVPERSFESNGPALEIKDYRNTSGPYYVEKDASDGSLLLKANPNHYHYDHKMPQEIHIVPTDYLMSLRPLLNGDVDLVPSTQGFIGEEARLVLESRDFEVHETLPLQLRLVRFSPQALQEFSPKQRMFAGLAVGRALSKLMPEFNGQPTTQFFQALSDGALNETQMKAIKRFRESEERPSFSRPIELTLSSRLVDSFAAELKDFPEIRVVPAKRPVVGSPPDERPEMYIVTNDSAWTEDLALLGHNFHEGAFTFPGFDAHGWFTAYLSEENKAERIQRLNKLHYDILMNASFVPISVSPYYIAVKKPWKLNQSNLSSGTELWRMRLD